MYIVGDKEVKALEKAVLSEKLFRYQVGRQCARFEKRYAESLGVKHVTLTSSGTTALTAALIGLGIGPGDEVLVPACTYMATAVSVLAAGAIPVIVDIDDSITISPKAVEAGIGPRTRAVIPVHMWGLACNMAAIMKVARKHKLLVVEDACQAIGGAYRGKALGTIGHAGVFSFNYYKNMTAGEGGALVTNDDTVAARARCHVDCCNFYWNDRDSSTEHFTASGSRASELAGAMLNVQLTRLPGMIKKMRAEKKRILDATRSSRLKPIRANSLDHECGTHVMYTLPSAPQADRFAKLVKGTVAGKTGRHVYTEWDPILDHKGAHHPALNPYLLKENKPCRKKYTMDMCAASLDILARTVMIPTHPKHTAADTKALIKTINSAAEKVLD